VVDVVKFIYGREIFVIDSDIAFYLFINAWIVDHRARYKGMGKVYISVKAIPGG
jgi:hypothetical protein